MKMFSEEGTGQFLSSRVRDIRPSGIRAFFDLNAAGGDTIALGVGEPDFVTPEKVREVCIQALNEGQTKYTSNAGLMDLREEITAYFSDSFALSYDPASAASGNYASFKGFNDQLSVQFNRNSYDGAGLAADYRAHYQTQSGRYFR